MKNKVIIFGIIIVAIIAVVISVSKNKMPNIIQDTNLQIKSDSSGKIHSSKIPIEYSFSIQDSKGNVVKDFAITHTKLMHIIVVRKDLAYFQHVHPEFNKETGVFMLKDLTFPNDGVYRIFADFVPSNTQTPTTISEDTSVGIIENYKPEILGSEEKAKIFNDINVSLMTDGNLKSGEESMLMFNLSQNGKPITDLETYLGALGHSVILREENLDFIHAHPVENINMTQNGNVNFMVDFPEAGKYKIFTQFQRNGEVFTTDFIVSVSGGVKNSSSMQGMDH